MIVYKIQNKINGKTYVGQTIRNLETRLAEHKRKCSVIGNALIKYGDENFDIGIIDIAKSMEELNQKEIYYINKFNCLTPYGYNLCLGGGNSKGYKHKATTKHKMSQLKQGKYIGTENPFFGKKHSDETRQHLSEIRAGRTLSETWKSNIAKSLCKSVKNITTGKIFESIKEAGQCYNIQPTHITRVCKGKRKSAGGYRWEYVTSV